MIDLAARIIELRRRWEQAPRTRAFIPLADQLRTAGRLEEALAVLDEGLALHPQAGAGLVTLARTLVDCGRTAPAAEVATRILEIDPDNLVALEILAAEDRRRGDFVAAIGHCERLAQLAPEDDGYRTTLAALREQRALAAATASDGDADTGFATLTLVDLYLAQGYGQKAEALLRRLADERPDDPRVRRRLASLAGADDGEWEPAISLAEAPAARAAAPRPDASAARLPVGAPTERREQARQQFAQWIDRIRTEREVAP